MNQDIACIHLQGLTKRFASGNVVSDIDLTIQNGEFLTLLGPSGCGKTTLLRLIAGFETPTSGRILMDGRDLSDLPPNRRPVNTVFQSYALFPHMTVAQNVAFGLAMNGVQSAERDRRVAEALRMVRLEDMGGRMPRQLSGGQQQRVAVARAVVNRPRALLLDEPLSALDAKLRKEMQLELKALHRSLGITFVFVTHSQEEAFSMSDRVAVMSGGRIVQIGAPREIYEDPRSLFVAGFVGEANVLDGEILSRNGVTMEARVAGRTMRLTAQDGLRAGDRVKVFLRPEDMRLKRLDAPGAGNGAAFAGRVEDQIYRGATIDFIVALDGGPRVTATEFFNENEPEKSIPPGTAVAVSWVKGWETVLPDDGSRPL